MLPSGKALIRQKTGDSRASMAHAASTANIAPQPMPMKT